MPMQSGSGWTGIPWLFCSCHQKQWPVTKLRRQDGLIVCPYGYDNPQRTRTVDGRQRISKDVLASSQREPEIASILLNNEDSSDDI